MNTGQPMYEWKDLPWHRIERQVFKLQKRIYQASRRGDTKTVHRLQRLLLKSWSAKCLAVRRITQDNRGKRTAGIDGKKMITPKQRIKLIEQLNLGDKPQALRRIWIPKPGKTEKRGLGIPTIKDRAQQTLVKLALEPEWEARFESNSYGFRSGRSCHDAIAAIYLTINKMPRYVLDADISKCFDQISHRKLLAKLQTSPSLRRTIRAWLKAGILDGETFFPTTAGVPQGGPLSPLLANVALHGLETTITTAFPKTKRTSGGQVNWKPKVVVYADDFVILHRNLEVIQEAQSIAIQWFQEIGLSLNKDKTRITHTLTPHQGNVGFDFLGFNIRQYKVGKNHSGKDAQGNLLGFKTIIQPSKKAIHKHALIINSIIRKYHTAPQAALIAKLNPIIKGWSQYYAPVASKRAFGKLSHITHQQLTRWAKRRHPNQPRKKIIPKYWRLETGYWLFATKQGHRLYRHHWTPIVRHVKIQGNRSPYDGDWAYWATRKGKHPELPKRTAFLLHQQKGKCAACGLYFKQEDLLEIDHIIPTSQGGRNCYENWQLLHQHCHDKKTEFDILYTKLRC